MTDVNLSHFRYEPDEVPKRKHHWGEPHAGFVKVHGRLVGKCPSTMSIGQAEALLHQGFYEDSDLPWPKRVFALGPDGVLYRFAETVPGQSYHGYPVTGHEYQHVLTAAERAHVLSRAKELGCEKMLRAWVNKELP